nr:hypothetical protein [Cytophagales bacterium]
MRSDRVKQALNALPEVGDEARDIVHSMKDEAESMRRWINDCILRQHMRNVETDRLSAETRTLIKAKSYDAFIDLSQGIHRDMKKTADALVSGFDLDKTGS